jgi:hypothetical protein
MISNKHYNKVPTCLVFAVNDPLEDASCDSLTHSSPAYPLLFNKVINAINGHKTIMQPSYS